MFLHPTNAFGGFRLSLSNVTIFVLGAYVEEFKSYVYKLAISLFIYCLFYYNVFYWVISNGCADSWSSGCGGGSGISKRGLCWTIKVLFLQHPCQCSLTWSSLQQGNCCVQSNTTVTIENLRFHDKLHVGLIDLPLHSVTYVWNG